MRGADEASRSLFNYVDLEERVPECHPLRLILRIVNDALAGLDAAFDAPYTDFGRPSIAPERLIRPLLSGEHFSVDGTLGKAFAMELEPMATPWLSVDEELSADGRQGDTGREQSPRATATS